MRKKLKDITFLEYIEVCKKSMCDKCPFFNYCGCSSSSMDNIDCDLDKEIDL